MKTWLMIGCVTLLSCPLMAETPADAYETPIEYQVDGQTFKSRMYRNPVLSNSLPGILVFPEYWGANDYATSRAMMLQELGYAAMVVDMYGDGKVTTDPKEAGQWSGEVKGDRAMLRRRAMAALEAFSSQNGVDARRMGAIGYCFGGTCALELARSNAPVRGVVSFHGGLAPGDGTTSETVKPAVLVLHGAVDPMVPPAEVQAFEKEMQDAGADWQLVSYGHAVHTFTNPAAGDDPSRGVAYNEKADKRSWEKMRDFLEAVVKNALR